MLNCQSPNNTVCQAHSWLLWHTIYLLFSSSTSSSPTSMLPVLLLTVAMVSPLATHSGTKAKCFNTVDTLALTSHAIIKTQQPSISLTPSTVLKQSTTLITPSPSTTSKLKTQIVQEYLMMLT